jgi:sugar lactone lactonase YvrE
MRVAPKALAGVSILLVSYLALWPTPVAPVAWEAPEDRGLAGPFESNGELSRFELLAGDLPGPEAVAADAQGRLYTGTLDGRIVTLDASGKSRTLARPGGRPLGLKVLADGSLVVANALRGVQHIDPSGKVRTLAERDPEGRRLTFPDDVELLPDGRLLFTDASRRFALPEFELDALEHRDTGSLFMLDPSTRKLTRIAGRLVFANGVAVHHAGQYAFVTETWNYRVLRVWLAGPRRGQRETVVDNLPGFPDNITYDRQRELFWVALGSPRDAGLDALAGMPALRKVVARLPRPLRPQARRHAMLVAIRPDGSVAHFFDDPGPDSYSPLTSALATHDALYLGSFAHAGVGRVKLADLGVR